MELDVARVEKRRAAERIGNVVERGNNAIAEAEEGVAVRKETGTEQGRKEDILRAEEVEKRR